MLNEIHAKIKKSTFLNYRARTTVTRVEISKISCILRPPSASTPSHGRDPTEPPSVAERREKKKKKKKKRKRNKE